MNGSKSCTGSRYGEPSGQSGLGGSSFGDLAINCSIGEPLADDTANRAIGAQLVINAERDAVAVPEIELGKIPMQVALVAALIDAGHAA